MIPGVCQIKTYGKWILAGEHTVLRGGPALVFPLLSLSLELRDAGDHSEFIVQSEGRTGSEYQLLLYGLIDKACEQLKISRQLLTGKFILKTDLPLGGGLGASAALCVAVSKLLAFKGFLEVEKIYEFSRQLENVFHGESSGVDIAVSLGGVPLRFFRNGPREELELAWSPKLYISFCGEKGLTQQCVGKVKEYIAQHPIRGEELDENMKMASRLAYTALLDDMGEEANFELLKSSIEKAEACFKEWGIETPALTRHMKELKRNGSVAVKPTGSGGGGYVLSLWKNQPSSEVINQLGLISCFS